jgi:hypothetical protein
MGLLSLHCNGRYRDNQHRSCRERVRFVAVHNGCFSLKHLCAGNQQQCRNECIAYCGGDLRQ